MTKRETRPDVKPKAGSTDPLAADHPQHNGGGQPAPRSPVANRPDIAPDADFTALLLGALGHRDDEFTSLLYENGANPHTAVKAPADAITAIATIPTGANVYFGVNPTRGPARNNAGRGAEIDVTRLAALWCDLDVKPGACGSLDVARAVVAELGIIVGARPSAIVESGHGLHAYWPITDGHIADGDTTAARALIRRFGRLVAVAAETLHAGVDNVYELARMLRVPGTFNNKSNGQGPLPVIAHADTGGPLTMAEVDERLTEVGIDEVDDDREQAAEEISPPTGWAWAANTCDYVAKMIDGWAIDTPTARHPWLVSGHVRLACAHRLGCLTEADYQRGRKILEARFTKLCQTTEPRREPKRFEIAGKKHSARDYGITKAATKTEQQASVELGGHSHADADTAAAEKSRAESDRQASEFVRTITLRKASGITDGVPEWAWKFADKGRLMRGTLNLFAGRPSAGKSTGARFFAAGYSNGTIGGCFDGSPQNVAYAAAEESIKYMVKPSLRAHGADLSRILFPEVYFDGQQIRLQSLRDEDLLAEQLVKHNVSIVFVDPIMSTIGSDVDIHRTNETRTHVEPWQRIAEKINGLVIGIVHLRKQFGTDILAAINGSSAFGEIARGVIAFAADETGEERVLSQEKNSAGENDLAIVYSIEPTIVHTDEGPAEVGKFVLGELSERRAGDLLRADNANEWLGTISLDVLEAVREIGGPAGPSQVAELVAGLDVDTAGKYMRRLAKANMLVKRGRGLYGLPNRKI